MKCSIYWDETPASSLAGLLFNPDDSPETSVYFQRPTLRCIQEDRFFLQQLFPSKT
jgi:hypothetical protein